LEHTLHRWSSFVIVPLFALANAGVDIGGDARSGAIDSPVTHGVVLGLVVGKFVGIAGFAWIAQRVRVAVMPPGVGWSELLAVSSIGGIGFTVSLFVASLAFEGALLDQAKIGILAGSLVAALLGSVLLLRLPLRGIPVDGGI
jgi:NhaA family Na+:H+ antiporter